MKKLFVVCACVGISGAVGVTQQSASTALALSDFFKPGVVFQDRNGDGAVDFVNARIVLAEKPIAGETAAAADVAVRLGYETSAMNLPLVAREGGDGAAGPRIFVGARALSGSGATAESLGGGSLKAGDGIVAAFTSSGQPAVAVLGGDEAGIGAAAVMLGGHLPYVWDTKSPTLDKIADDVKQWLAGKGMNASSVIVPSVAVKIGVDGADRVGVDVQMANG